MTKSTKTTQTGGTKLGDAELVLLTSGGKRDDRLIETPPTMKPTTRQRAGGNLIKRGLAEEQPARAGDPVWREDAEGRFALAATTAGLAAVGIEDEVEKPVGETVVAAATDASHPREGTKGALVVSLLSRAGAQPSDEPADPITIPWPHPSTRRHRTIMAAPDRGAPHRPIRSESRATLLTAIARGRRWLAEMMTSPITPDLIASREGCSRRQVNATLSLVSLSPAIVEAIIAGRIPHGVALRDLTDPPLTWADQSRQIAS